MEHGDLKRHSSRRRARYYLQCKEAHDHDPVAAFIAITSPTNSKSEAQRSHRSSSEFCNGQKRRVSYDNSHCSMLASSPGSWGMLLSSPDELDLGNSSIDSDAPFPEHPLAGDFLMTLCGSGSGTERKSKQLSSSVMEACPMDHYYRCRLLRTPICLPCRSIPKPYTSTLPPNKSEFKPQIQFHRLLRPPTSRCVPCPIRGPSRISR